MPVLQVGWDKYWNLSIEGVYDERLPSSDIPAAVGKSPVRNGDAFVYADQLNVYVGNIIDKIIKDELNNFASYTVENSTHSVYNYRTLYTTNTSITNGCTERYFYDVIVNKIIKSVYDAFNSFQSWFFPGTDLGYYSYIRSINFRGIISDIHKDFMWIIKTNMINTNGDIAKDPDVSKKIGGFSMGVEIVKLTSKLNFKYVS